MSAELTFLREGIGRPIPVLTGFVGVALLHHVCACVGAVPPHGLSGVIPAMKKPRAKHSKAKTRARQGRVLVVTSGKGGVGKTTSTAALGAALAQTGQKVVVVDFDVGLRNLDLVMGAERRVVFDLINVIKGEAKLAQALIQDKRLDTLALLPASQSRDKDSLTEEGVARVVGELREQFDWVICDSPAGIETGALLAMRHADVAIVVANPEVSSIRDADRIIGLLDARTLKAETGQRIDKHLLLTRYDPSRARRGEIMKVEDVLEILSIPLLGVVPESGEVLRSSNVGAPVTLGSPESASAQAYLEAARRLNGEAPGPIATSDKPGLFGKLFMRRAA
jgi:septum site-determining protein MinD